MVDDVLYHRILTGLLDVRKVEVYFFHKRFSISPGDLLRALTELTSFGYILMDDNIVSITPKGKKYLFLSKKVYFKNQNKPWNYIPDRMIASNEKSNERFYPKKFDVNFLNKSESE